MDDVDQVMAKIDYYKTQLWEMLEMQIVDPERNPDGLLRHDYEFYLDAVKQIDTKTLA